VAEDIPRPQPGDLWYPAAAANGTNGKTAEPSHKVQVRLELVAPEDEGMLRSMGVDAMRRGRVARLVRQADAQGGRLSVDDLAFLTCVPPETVERDMAGIVGPTEAVAECEPAGTMSGAPEGTESETVVSVSTSSARRFGAPSPDSAQSSTSASTEPAGTHVNGTRQALSRRAAAVELYLEGLPVDDIVACTAHPEASIRRYLSDFRQVASLYSAGADPQEIKAASGRPQSLIAEYIDLYEGARHETSLAPRLTELLEVEPASAGWRARR
jgi:hypothetical protein